MKKELFVSILSASFILSVLTVPVFSEKISAKMLNLLINTRNF